jgi:RHS repeat-associated protein
MPRTSSFVFVAIVLCALSIAAPAVYTHRALLFFNSPPSANGDSYTLHGNGVIGSLLANDSDPDPGNTLSAVLVTTPTNGVLSNVGNGNFSYTRNSSSWTGTDSFTYKACDNGAPSLCSAAATVNITVTNQAPVAVTDVYTVHGSTIIGPYKANDSDADGDTLTSVQLTSPTHGTLQGTNQPDMPRYSPNYGYVGTDSFTYKVCDPFNACSTTTVLINVNDIPPTANADYFIVFGSGIIGPMRANDYDSDGDSLPSFAMITGASHGTVYGLANPPYPDDVKQYVANVGFSGTDSFQYIVCDNLGACSTATVYILVLPGAAPNLTAPYGNCCVTDPHKPTSFQPEGGGLRLGSAGTSGPFSGDPVNLATGRESYFAEPDLSVYNPSGPTVVWQRAFLSDQALAAVSGYGSPSFTRGWVHNYDLRIDGTSGSWGALKLVYPNGATETLTPQLSGGVPTGSFTTPAGAPYIVTGVAGTPTGTWQSVTVTWQDQTKWKFTLLTGTTYALAQITNRLSLSLNLSWNSNRALTQISDASTSTVLLTLTYDSRGRITTATDAYNRQVAYTFDPGSSTTPAVLQKVSQVVTAGTSNPPAQFTYAYTSDKGQLLNTITVPSPTGNGNSTATINYSSVGKVTSTVDANGNQRVYTYNSGNTQVQVKDPANNVALSWTQKFNSNNLGTGATDAANHSTTIAYNDSANPLKPTNVTDRNGHAITYTYDAFGNILTVTTPRKTTTYTWSYTNFALGRLTSIQEGSKPATAINYYEPSGLINTITGPEPNNGAGTVTTTYTYDSLGNVLTVTTPGNNAASSITTTLNYTTDGGYSQSAKIGQPLTITNNLGHTTHLRYDSQGRTTSVTDALGNETTFTYNLVGQPLTNTFPATAQTGTGNSHSTNVYLYVGGPLTSTAFYDESNTQVRQVTRTYGAEGEVLTVAGSTEPASNTYDALYRLKTLKDGNNNATTYTYNNVGLLSSITMPGSEVTQFTSYDNEGHLLQRIDGNNVTTNYIYNDPESLLTDIQYLATPSLNVHFTYDSYRRLSGMTDSTGSHSYVYGNVDELLSATTTYTGIAGKTISYFYYPDGSRESMTTPAGTFDYTYDAAGRPASMTNPFSESTSWSYLNNNWLQIQTLANGVTGAYTYNALGQVTRLLNQLGSTTISDFSSITYDGVGNRTSVTATIPGAPSLNGTTGFAYDSKDQITQETSTRNGGFTDNFTYDSAGNPTSFKGLTKSYNSNNQQTGTGYVYDSNGNPTTYNGTALAFDAENRLTSFGLVLTAGYTASGLRAWKDDSINRRYFLYDGATPVIELTAAGAIAAVNTFGASGLISRPDATASTFYSFDSEGNVSQKTDSTGAVQSSLSFTVHGSLKSGTLTDPFGFKAQFTYYTDTETALQLLTNRYFDNSAGRFLTRDPLEYRGGINLYSYVTNNPVNRLDPMGLDGWGNDVADWLDAKIDNLQRHWQYGDQE